MKAKNSHDSPEKESLVSSDKNELETNQESKGNSKGILSYSSKGTQSVVSLFGVELTAPSGLKNPGIVYVAFIVINLFVFLVLRSFISG